MVNSGIELIKKRSSPPSVLDETFQKCRNCEEEDEAELHETPPAHGTHVVELPYARDMMSVTFDMAKDDTDTEHEWVEPDVSDMSDISGDDHTDSDLLTGASVNCTGAALWNRRRQSFMASVSFVVF